jgi:hypothetical protein
VSYIIAIVSVMHLAQADTDKTFLCARDVCSSWDVTQRSVVISYQVSKKLIGAIFKGQALQ